RRGCAKVRWSLSAETSKSVSISSCVSLVGLTPTSCTLRQPRRVSNFLRASVIDAYPKLLGIGLDEKAALIVQGDRFQVIGEGRVAIYENKKHGDRKSVV